MKYTYIYKFYNTKLIYGLNTPFRYHKKYKRGKKRCYLGSFYFRRTYNNIFLTTTSFITGNVIASFSSKMFKNVQGKRQSFALILLKKLGFIVGVKTIINRIFDVNIMYYNPGRRRRFRILAVGLYKSGLMFRKFRYRTNRPHNGCRGKSRRRL